MQRIIKTTTEVQERIPSDGVSKESDVIAAVNRALSVFPSETLLSNVGLHVIYDPDWLDDFVVVSVTTEKQEG